MSPPINGGGPANLCFCDLICFGSMSYRQLPTIKVSSLSSTIIPPPAFDSLGTAFSFYFNSQFRRYHPTIIIFFFLFLFNLNKLSILLDAKHKKQKITHGYSQENQMWALSIKQFFIHMHEISYFDVSRKALSVINVDKRVQAHKLNRWANLFIFEHGIYGKLVGKTP